jgi:hypothetical protein
MLRPFITLSCLLALMAPGASAALIAGSGFQFSISEKEMALVHDFDSENPSLFNQEEYDEVLHYIGWDSSFQRLADRNMPSVEITNNNLSNANIVGLRLTIGDTRYNFGSSIFGSPAKIAKSDGTTTLSSVNTNAGNGSLAGDILNITLGGGGIAPGDSFRFKIDLDVDAGQVGLYPHPDFRRVLFDMNGVNPSDNMIVTAIYSDAMASTLSLTLEDYDVEGPQSQFFNQNLRPYSVMEGVDVFGGPVLTENEIPEPATLALVALAGLGLVVGKRRS